MGRRSQPSLNPNPQWRDLLSQLSIEVERLEDERRELSAELVMLRERAAAGSPDSSPKGSYAQASMAIGQVPQQEDDLPAISLSVSPLAEDGREERKQSKSSNNIRMLLPIDEIRMQQQAMGLVPSSPMASPMAGKRPSCLSTRSSRRRPLNFHAIVDETFNEDGPPDDVLVPGERESPSPRRSRPNLLLADVYGASEEAVEDTSLSPMRGQDMPKPLMPWPVWKDGVEAVSTTEDTFECVYEGRAAAVSTSRRLSGEALESSGCWASFVMKPSGRKRVIWDLCSFAIMGYDVLVLPMVVFDIPPSGFTDFMRLLIIIFWTIDFILCMCTGYYNQGIMEMRVSRIVYRYMTTFGLLDVSLLTLDYTLLIVDSQAASDGYGMIRITKSVRLLRILRMIRLLRVVKVMRLVEDFCSTIHSESLWRIAGILKLLSGIIMVNHFIACGWYFVGTIYDPDVDRASWVKDAKVKSGEISIPYAYTTALHWSLTQFTPASMEVVPCNIVERTYTIIVLVFALVVFSSFVSSITSAVSFLRVLNEERSKQQLHVHDFITENRISLDVANRVYAFLKHCSYTSKKRVHMDDIAVFSRLPGSLKSLLHVEMFAPLLCTHPFFFVYSSASWQGLCRICHYAVSEISLLPGHELFQYKMRATHMYAVVTGKVGYYFKLSDEIPVSLSEGSFISEAILWTKWEHAGKAVAHSEAELYAINARTFRSIAARSNAFPECFKYAHNFPMAFLEHFSGVGTLLSDVWFDREVAEQMVRDSFGDETILAATRAEHTRAYSGSRLGSTRRSLFRGILDTKREGLDTLSIVSRISRISSLRD